MSPFGRQITLAAKARQSELSIVTDVREEAGLLMIDLELDSPAFFHRQEIDSWMFDCAAEALRFCKDKRGGFPIYRGVDRISCERAICNGIDVIPSDAHWYGGPLDKALEYGGEYPHVLIIDAGAVERTRKQVAVSAPQADHDAARAWAGSQGWGGHGGWINYSRLPETDDARGTDYEAAYAWFIPGDAKAALIGVIRCLPAAETVR